MKTDIFETIASIIQLPFENETFQSGAVCFANDKEVRADFKLYFTTYDVVNYIYGILFLTSPNEEVITIESLKIQYPSDANYFWKHSEMGKEYRQTFPRNTLEVGDLEKINWLK